MPIPKTLLLIQAGIFGLIIGSFLNVCIYRLPKKVSILGRSLCPSCQKPIPLYRNIPLVSYLLQGGKSACCHQPISLQYPIIEALAGVISIVTLLHSQDIYQFFIWYLLFMCPLLIVAIIDLKLKIIPDSISLPFIVVGVLVNLYEYYPNWLGALKLSGLGILIGGGSLLLLAEVISRLKKRDAMGGGDIKLAAMLGAFLGWKALIFVFFASAILAIIYYILVAMLNQLKDKTIPFGPFLAMGAMIFWLYGEPITDLYFKTALGMPFNPLFQ